MTQYRSLGDMAANAPTDYDRLWAEVDCPVCCGDRVVSVSPLVWCPACGGVGVVDSGRPEEPEPTDAEIEAMAEAAASMLEDQVDDLPF